MRRILILRTSMTIITEGGRDNSENWRLQFCPSIIADTQCVEWPNPLIYDIGNDGSPSFMATLERLQVPGQITKNKLIYESDLMVTHQLR